MRAPQAFRWVVLAGLGLPLGCVTTHRVDLSTPRLVLKQPPPGYRGDEAAEVPGMTVRMETFEDRRDDQSSLGGESYVISSGCMGTNFGYRRLRTEDNVALWVTAGLGRDLRRAGYSVASGGAGGAAEPALVVSGEVIRVDNSTRPPESASLATVILAIRARRGDEWMVDEWFQGRAATDEWSHGLAQALSEATSSFLRQLKERTRVKK